MRVGESIAASWGSEHGMAGGEAMPALCMFSHPEHLAHRACARALPALAPPQCACRALGYTYDTLEVL